MKVTIEQHGLKSTVEYHSDNIDVHQLGSLLHYACLATGWTEAVLEEIFKPDEFEYGFQPKIKDND